MANGQNTMSICFYKLNCVKRLSDREKIYVCPVGRRIRSGDGGDDEHMNYLIKKLPLWRIIFFVTELSLMKRNTIVF